MRYFFHVKTSAQTAEDIEGQELPGLEEARQEAIYAARELIAMKLMAGEAVDWNGLIEISCDGQPVAAIGFMEAAGIPSANC